MEEICIKVDISPQFKKEFVLALARVIKVLEDKLELAIAEEIISKSKFIEKDAEELSDKVKQSMHEELINKGLI